MAKVKRSGKGSVGGKPKGKSKLRRPKPRVAAEPPGPGAASDSTASSDSAAPMTLVASVTRSVTVVSAGPTSAGAMPVAFAAASVTTESFATDAELFDVVCSFDSVVLSSVDFGVAQSTARKHNKAHPGHDAQPIRQHQ